MNCLNCHLFISSCCLLISEEDFEEIVEGMRQQTLETKMEMVPWLRGYIVQMEDLYTELTVGKIENKPTGPESKVINDSKELSTKHNYHTVHEKGREGSKRKKGAKGFW